MRSLLLLTLLAATFVVAAREERATGGTAPRPADGLLTRFQAGDGLTSLTAGWGDVWANDYGREELVRIDGRSGRVVARLPVGRRIEMAAHGRALWALRWGGRFFRRPNGPLLRIDPATNRIAARIPLRAPSGRPMVAFGVLAGDGGVWVWGPSRVLRVDPSSGRVRQELEAGERHGELTGAVLYRGGLVAVTASGRFVSFDPRGIRLGTHVPALARAQSLTVAQGRLFAAAAGTAVAVDAATGRLLWRRPLGFRVSTLLASGGVLLAQGAAFGDPGDRIWALDPATGRLLAGTTLPSFSTTSMALAGGALWVATGAGEVIVAPRLLTRLFLARARAGASPAATRGRAGASPVVVPGRAGASPVVAPAPYGAAGRAEQP